MSNPAFEKIPGKDITSPKNRLAMIFNGKT